MCYLFAGLYHILPRYMGIISLDITQYFMQKEIDRFVAQVDEGLSPA